MKRIKVKITDKNTFFKEFGDGSCIGGSYGEPNVATLSLNENEFKALSLFMGEVSDLRHDVALFKFSQCYVLTDWHKRIICNTFPQITKNVTIEFL
jgi:hypothetical protein